MVATGVMRSVLPSAAAPLTNSFATWPPAPGLFSTITGRPSDARMCSPTIRERRSLVAPAGKPSTIRTTPSCAAACSETSPSRMNAHRLMRSALLLVLGDHLLEVAVLVAGEEAQLVERA